jgi:hypothetical protein
MLIVIIEMLADRERGAERRDGPAGHGGVRVEPRHHLGRALLGGAAGVRLLQGGGRRRQARQGLLPGPPRLPPGVRRHRHLQHLHADVPVPFPCRRRRAAARARRRAAPLLQARADRTDLRYLALSGDMI